MIASEWNIPPRAEQCAACGRAFEDGQTIRACIHAADGGFARTDVCENCPIPEDLEPLGLWRTRFRLPQSDPKPQFDRGGLLELLAETAETSDPQSLKFRFVLALLLWRKKALRLIDTRRSGGAELWDFAEPKTGTRHRVVRPELTEDDLARLSAQLEALLHVAPAASETSSG